VNGQDPSFIAPHKSMLETLCKSEETPFVNRVTRKNIAKASKAWSVTLSKRMTQWWKDADNREKFMKTRWSDEQREKQSHLKTDWWKVGDRREKMSDLMKKQWEVEEYRLTQQRGWTEERRRAQGDRMKKIKANMSAADRSAAIKQELLRCQQRTGLHVLKKQLPHRRRGVQ